MSELLGPDGGRARKEDQPSVTIDAIEMPLPAELDGPDAARFQQLYCIGEQQTPLGNIRVPIMSGPAMLVAIETANALAKRDEKIEAMEKVIDDLNTKIEDLADRLAKHNQDGHA